MKTTSDNLKAVLGTLPKHVRLVAISKTQPVQRIMDLYRCGHISFGENKVQELVEKYQDLPKDIEWHMVGHLQSNKVKYIAPFISMIHSIDSLKLLKVINKEGGKHNRVINCLLQFHIAEEETKFGMDQQEATELLESDTFRAMKNVAICGVMGMATFTRDQDQIRKEFSHLHSLFVQLRETYFRGDTRFCEISMGMSDDYLLGIEQGSTLVRIGSALFGERT